MAWVDKVQDAIAYIEEHLLEPITIEAVGRAIDYAPSSFQNLFSVITGYSVGEYIRFRRLSCAADELAEGATSVTEAAFTYGYETVEAFSKAFKRFHGCPPSRFARSSAGYRRFSPISISYAVQGGFSMRRNLIPNLLRVDWSDPQRQNEYVNSVVSALSALGERLDYDSVCAVSGSAFRTSFSMPSHQEWNHANYHVAYTPIIIEHTFRMLGYKVTHHVRGDYRSDRERIMASIDRGVPVITLGGVINCSDACVISGYDNDGDVLLGYSPFMDVQEDHDEAPDDTGYFRKSEWHDGYFASGYVGRILIIEGPAEKLSREAVVAETKRLAKRLILEEVMVPGQYNGLAAHSALANALLTYTWEDAFEPYLNVTCDYKQYLDRQYAAAFFRDNGEEELARRYEEIAALCRRLGELIPQDFAADELFEDKRNLEPYSHVLLEIRDREREVAELLD